MALQQPRPTEHLSAHVTRVRQLVRQLVHRERGHADVRLSAHVAPLGRLRVQAPVRLLVPRQVRRRRVVLATVSARVTGCSPCGVGHGKNTKSAHLLFLFLKFSHLKGLKSVTTNNIY